MSLSIGFVCFLTDRGNFDNLTQMIIIRGLGFHEEVIP